MSTKHSINLLQAELYSKQALLTLSKVAIVWLVLLIIMISWALMTRLSFDQSASEHQALLQLKDQKQTLSDQLQKQLANKGVTPALLKTLDAKIAVLHRKKALFAKLTDSNQTFSGGFVMAMNDLSNMHNEGITIQTISIKGQGMEFTGVAKSPQDVPAWLNGFEKSSLLSGRGFANFELAQNEQGTTSFVVSSLVEEAISQ
jgi:Tfp pilus assembly protein PilN